ncbi:exportin-4 isoform X1 [Hydra vulgaris]|uniref:exportin-4 isoform X1 n=1 Tax=Hydra vulgaris TaxID=6087 RepID=UPI001F5F8862|nr:exportin-4 [Hydra vulgaris]
MESIDIIRELENAAVVVMAPPTAVSSEERHNAEQIFLQFRKTRTPYELGKKILETCKVDYVLFEAAVTIKEAIIREWALLKKEDIDSLCSFLLCCAMERADLQHYVREQLLQVIAIVFKLGTLDDIDARLKLVDGLKQLLASGNVAMELTCSSIIKALLTEYSITKQSTNFGMSLEFHSKCKKSFETKDLLTIFMMTIQTLQKYANKEIKSLTRQDQAVFNRFLSLAEQIFHWEFLCGNPLSQLRIPCLNETMQKVIFKPNKSWQEIILNPSLLELFFKLQLISISHSELSHHCMQCLVQLASVTGAVFSSDEHSVNYLAKYMTCLLSIINVHHWSGHEALGLSNIFFRIADIFPIKILILIPRELLFQFFDGMTFLTCSFLEASVHAEDDFDNEYGEAANILLDGWMSLVSHADNFPNGVFVEHSLKIVSIYLNVHLAPPHGIRKPENITNEIDCDLVEIDRIAYVDELSNIGHLARQCLMHILPVLHEKFQVRIQQLNKLLQSVKQADKIFDRNNATSLFEDLHWLLMVTSFILTHNDVSESPQIPSEVIDFTKHFLTTQCNSIGHSVNYLMSEGNEGDIHQVDPVISLFKSVVNLIKIQMEFSKSSLTHLLSPELASTSLWFLKRWTQGYLSYSEVFDTDQTLSACFKSHSSCGMFFVKLVLDVVLVFLSAWSAEPQTTDDAVKLLIQLLSNKSRMDVCLSFPTIHLLAEKFVNNTPDIVSLTPSVNRQLVQALMRAYSTSENNSEKPMVHNKILLSIVNRYKELRSNPQFMQISQQPAVRETIVQTFECIRGLTIASTTEFGNLLFEEILPILQDAVKLFQLYNNFVEIIVVILEMFLDVVESLLCVLNKTSSNLLCKVCIDMMTEYSKFNLGKQVIDSTSEEDKYADILLLMRILTRILSKDYLDLGPDDDKHSEATSIVEVVLFGLHLIIPLINQELMRFPNLSSEYFKLVTFVCEVYPEKMKILPDVLFRNFMASIQMAVDDYSPDTAKCALDALSSLAKYCYNECDTKDPVNQPLYSALKEFLKVVFRNVVLAQFDVDLIEPSSECLFLLICCHQEEYLMLANDLIAQQHVTNETFRLKLTEAFNILTPNNLKLSPNRQSLRQFRKNLEVFLQNVKGFLCFK